HTLHQRRHPSAAIAWVVTLLLLPYVGLPLYLLFVTLKRVRREYGPPRATVAGAETPWPQRLAAAMDLAPAASYRSLRIHENGEEALQALWEQIDAAVHTLDLCTFMLGRDAMADALCEKLARKARGGVRVRLLIDGVGRLLEPHRNLKALTGAGVQLAIFAPPLRPPFRGRLNLRNHRKMVIADGSWLWSGGRNLTARYFEGAPGVTPWKDLSFDLQGAVAGRALECFERDWSFAGGAPGVAREAPPEAASPTMAQVIPSGPDQCDDTLYALLVMACFNARERIVAVTPYFVPDDSLLMGLTLAARRNVEVNLIMPAKSNHRLADLARPRALRELAGAGAEVWLVPGMIHAKAVVIDSSIALAGSANLDGRSLLLNYELMVAFYDSEDVRRFAGWMERQRQGASRYIPRLPGLAQDMAEGIVLWLTFQL
ncbi:MAG: phospholipase D-like domain-containing protein, partial [Burkholderiales bacterium]